MGDRLIIAKFLPLDCALAGHRHLKLGRCAINLESVYLDNIVRVNRTFTFDATSFSFAGLAIGKKALVITPSAGNFAPHTPLGSMNFCETYLHSILNFIGIEHIQIVAVPNQFMPDEIRQHELECAHTKLLDLAATW